MSVSIPAESAAFVEALVGSGAYDSSEAVVAAALQSFERETMRLRAEILPAIEQLERGEYIELNSAEEIDAFFDQIVAEANEEIARERGSQ